MPHFFCGDVITLVSPFTLQLIKIVNNSVDNAIDILGIDKAAHGFSTVSYFPGRSVYHIDSPYLYPIRHKGKSKKLSSPSRFLSRQLTALG